MEDAPENPEGISVHREEIHGFIERTSMALSVTTIIEARIRSVRLGTDQDVSSKVHL